MKPLRPLATSLAGLLAALLVLAACAPTAAPAPAQPAQPPAAAPAPARPAQPPAAAPAPAPTATPAGPKRGGIAKFGMLANPTSMDPARSGSARDQMIYRGLYNTLVYMDPKTGKWVPELAEQWAAEKSQVFTFKLRSGVTFRDGTPFNAQAAKASLERVLDPATKSPAASELNPIKSIEAVDPTTLRITLKSPYAPFLDSLYGRSSMFYSPPAAQRYGADTAGHAEGTGPFSLVEWVSDSHVLMEANPKYWDKPLPYLERVRIQIIPDASVRVAALKAGNIDATSELAVAAVKELEARQDIRVVRDENAVHAELITNSLKPPFDNENLRKAVAWGMGPEDVVAVAHAGYGQPGIQTFMFGAWRAYMEDLSKYPVLKKDPAKVKEYLQKGGQPNGFEFTVTHWADLGSYLQVMQANLASFGIKMKIERIEVGVYSARNRAGQYQALYSHGKNNAQLDPAGWIARYTAKGASFNRFWDPPAAAEEAMKKAEASTDPDVRRALYWEYNKHLVADSNIRMTVMVSPEFGAARADLEDVVLHPDGAFHYNTAWWKR